MSTRRRSGASCATPTSSSTERTISRLGSCLTRRRWRRTSRSCTAGPSRRTGWRSRFALRSPRVSVVSTRRRLYREVSRRARPRASSTRPPPWWGRSRRARRFGCSSARRTRRRPAGSTQSTWGFDVARRGVLLLSGGFDSPVAGHLMARQGLDLIAAHFSLEPITDDAAAMKARTLCGILRIPSLYVVRVGEAFAEVAQKANRRFYFILTKRLMVRLADAIADLEGAEVLVTGENLGQVSSQTVASLRAIDAVAHHPILRPLIGFDKQEIVDRAKLIGTYEVSKGPEICDLLGPPRPSTHARLDQILAEETKLDLPELVSSCLSKLASEKFKANGPPAPLPPRTAG